jgi:cell division septum initiation protein DivIVA
MWECWKAKQLMKRLIMKQEEERKLFLEKIKAEGFTLLNDSEVVCDHCGANCGQCGIGVRAHRLTQEYDRLNACQQLTRESFIRNM